MREGNWVGMTVAALVVVVAAAPGGAQVRDDLTVYDATPHEDTVHLADATRRQFAVWVEGDGLRYRWTLDDIPIGDRHSLTLDPATLAITGTHRLAVVVEGEGGRATRGWTVVIDAAAAVTTTSTSATQSTRTTTTTSSSTSTSRSTTTVTSTTTTTTTRRTTTTTQRPTTSTTTSTATTRPPATTTSTTATPRPPTTTPTTVGEADVRALLARYAAAWRAHDAEALRAIGQVSTEGQMQALRSYFDTVQDLDVDVTVLEIRTLGDEARVRFIRRDHFKDPAGNPVVKESPPIEKRVIRTPGGLSFAPVQ